jgi:hypothetical protein
MRKLLVAVFIVSLTGCASVSKTYDQNGDISYGLNCSGSARGWDKCYSKAGELCGSKGYKIFTKDQEQFAYESSHSDGYTGNSSSFGSVSGERSMLVTCNK